MELKHKIRLFINQQKSKFFPYHYNQKLYQDTFLNHHAPNYVDIDTKVDKKIYVFWTGDNPLTENRQRCLQALKDKSDVEIVLITPQNLQDYILPNAPLHPAYPYLSLVHKADYLRCYFMHHFGGGYSDIKECQSSWQPYFDKLNSSNHYILGYPELKKNDVARLDGQLGQDLKANFSKIIGNVAYICRPNTPFTQEWYAELLHRMDFYADKLEQNRGNIWGDNEGYPIAWTNILGDIFHPLCLKYMQKIGYENHLCPSLENYR